MDLVNEVFINQKKGQQTLSRPWQQMFGLDKAVTPDSTIRGGPGSENSRDGAVAVGEDFLPDTPGRRRANALCNKMYIGFI